MSEKDTAIAKFTKRVSKLNDRIDCIDKKYEEMKLAIGNTSKMFFHYKSCRNGVDTMGLKLYLSTGYANRDEIRSLAESLDEIRDEYLDLEKEKKRLGLNFEIKG